MEENELYDRIGESDLNPNYKDGQVYQHEDVNNMISIFKVAINENYHDIQKLENGETNVGSAGSVDGATVSRYLDEELQADDNKVPSSQQAKAYMDNLFAEYSAPVRGVDYWTDEDKQEIIDDASIAVLEDINGADLKLGDIVVDDVSCKNMLNKNSWTKNYINPSTGEVTPSINSALFNYIEVNPSTEYTISFSSAVTDCKVAYYDASGTWLSSSATITTTTTITTPNDAKYIRVYINIDGNGIDQAKIDNINAQIELGSTATSYAAYKKIIKEQNGYVKEDTTFYANDVKCKNMLPMASSQTINGVTFTVNQDGTITLSGTATAVVFFPIKGTNNLFQYIQGQIYTLSGCPAGGDYSNKYSLYTDIGTQKESDIGEGVTFIATGTTGTIYIVVRSGQNVDGLVFKPQLEIGSVATPYTPYKAFATEYKWDVIQNQDVVFTNNTQSFNIPNMEKYDRIRVAVNSSYNRTYFVYFEKNDLIGNENIFQKILDFTDNANFSSLVAGRITLNVVNKQISIIYDKSNATFPLTLKNIVGYYRGEQASSPVSGTRMLSVTNEEENR